MVLQKTIPQTPGANGILAPSGMGKKTTLIAMLLGPYKGIFDQVHVFSPSADVDSSWLPVKEMAGNLMEGSTFNAEWDEASLRKVLDAQRNKMKDLKHAKSMKPLPQILKTIDDPADRSDIMHSASNILTTLFIRGAAG